MLKEKDYLFDIAARADAIIVIQIMPVRTNWKNISHPLRYIRRTEAIIPNTMLTGANLLNKDVMSLK